MYWVFQHPSSPNANMSSDASKPSATSSDNFINRNSPSTSHSLTSPMTNPPCSEFSSSSSGDRCSFVLAYKSPIVEIDSKKSGNIPLDLVIASIEAVQENNLNLALAIVTKISVDSQAGAMQIVAAFLAEALACKIHRVVPPHIDHSSSNRLQKHFYKASPYLKVAHLTANKAILEAFAGKERVHLIDFSINQGKQWPWLMQALARRPGGPPTFRLSGIGPRGNDSHQKVEWKLDQLAKSLHLPFTYRGLVAESLADLDATVMLGDADESVAVNSVFELHKLLSRTGAIDKVLSMVKQLNPEIVTIIEQESDNNDQIFSYRFTRCLRYFWHLFESLEGSTKVKYKESSKIYLGNQILNSMAHEGEYRIERYEPLTRWRARMESAGFVPIHLGSNALENASFLLSVCAIGGNYTLEENNGCLMLGWQSCPLIATSAWGLSNRNAALL